VPQVDKFLAVLSKLCIRDAPPQKGVFPDPAPPQPASLSTWNAGFYYTRKALSQCHLSALQIQDFETFLALYEPVVCSAKSLRKAGQVSLLKCSVCKLL